MKSARGKPVACIGLTGQSGYRLDPRVGLYRIVIVMFVAVGGEKHLFSGCFGSRLEGHLVSRHGPDLAGESVGERDGRFVVAEACSRGERTAAHKVWLALPRK